MKFRDESVTITNSGLREVRERRSPPQSGEVEEPASVCKSAGQAVESGCPGEGIGVGETEN